MTLHHHEGTLCYCHNNPLGLPPRGPQWVIIEGIMNPNDYTMRWLKSDPNRPYTKEELEELRKKRSSS